MLVDIDIDAGSPMILNHRGDGTTTISVPLFSFQRAATILASTLDVPEDSIVIHCSERTN